MPYRVDWRPDGGEWRTIATFANKGEYVTLTAATLPPEHRDREPGWERYAAHLKHEDRADDLAFRLARRAFPELRREGLAWPSLWYVGLLDNEELETHATRTIRIAQREINALHAAYTR